MGLTFSIRVRVETMKFAVAASLVASAAAFAPAKQSAKTSALSMAFESELGAQALLGFFDPLGMVSDGDQAKFDRLRGVEIKHGRICQLGVVGYLVTYAGIRLPGDISFDGTKFSDIPSGWDGSFAVPVAGALQVLANCGFLELAGWKQDESPSASWAPPPRRSSSSCVPRNSTKDVPLRWACSL
jgi:hypothetical protein